MSMIQSVLHQVEALLDFILLREVQDDGANEACTDNANIIGQVAKVLLDIGQVVADYLHEEKHDEHCLAERRNRNMDQDVGTT